MYRTIATKVKVSTLKLVERICAKKHMTIYTLIQMYVDVTVRYMSDRHNLSPKMERMMQNFENLEGWDKSFNLADHTTQPEVDTALYFIGDEEHKGLRGVLVEKPFFGQWTQDFNVQHILERIICLLFPTRYKKMRRIANDMGATSLLDMFDRLIEDHIKDSDMASIRSEFEDCDRSDYGTKPSDHLYKQKKHVSVDTARVNRQQTIHFEPEDVPELPELVRPFDQEY